MVDRKVAGQPVDLRPRWTVSGLDVLLAVGAFAFGTLDTLITPGETSGYTELATFVVNAVLSAALLLRRRAPSAVTLAAALGFALFRVHWPLVVGLYTVASERTGRRAVAVIVPACAAVLVNPWQIAPDVPWLTALSLEIAPVAGAVVLGVYVRTRRDLVSSLVERADRLEREQELLTQQALNQERNRIAREMHDVVGHRMSLVVLHAGALALVTQRDPQRTAEVAELIRDSAQKALEELRHTVALLRTRDHVEALPATTTSPFTTVSDIERLVAQSRSAGLPVNLHVEGNRRPILETVERAAYRVVQEALTNVHKHAPAAKTAVVLRFLPDVLEVAVINEGARRTDEAQPAFPSGGHGLAGLRERVSLVGGELHAGPLPLGGFRVLAILPLEPAAPDTPGQPE